MDVHKLVQHIRSDKVLRPSRSADLPTEFTTIIGEQRSKVISAPDLVAKVHAGFLVAAAFEIRSPRLAVLLQGAEWGLAISIRRLTCFWLPVIRVVDDYIAVDVGACAVGVLANKVLVDLSDLLTAVGVGVLVAEPEFELVDVLFIVHFLERFGGNGDGVFEALGQFVFVVLICDCVEVV